METTVATPRRKAAWKPSRRLTDFLFRGSVPGRHHNLDSRIFALLTIRETRP